MIPPDDQWSDLTLKTPRSELPDGTSFLLRLKNGNIHFCRTIGNLTNDKCWKAIRLSDKNIIQINNLKGARFTRI